jgi:transmembrane sensor
MMGTNHDISEDLVLAEASAWLARLQGPSRTAAADAAFKAWLAEDATHARAFGRVTETWDIIPGAARLGATQVATKARPRRRVGMALAACLVLATITGGITLYELRSPVYQTEVGGQQTVMLSDGSRITLNTDSKLTVAYSKTERRIVLDHGEAIFDDVKDARRPFIVQTGGGRIRALGTVFDVRSDPSLLEVTLMQGQVEVSPANAGQAAVQQGGATVLSPGERMTLRPGGEHTVDHPNIQAITAWQHGEAMFDNATLAEVMAELNRYGNTHIRLDDPALAQLRVSGVFTTRDPAEVAEAIAKLHNLNVVKSGQSIVITR